MKTSRAASLVAFAVIAALAAGCSEPKEPARVDQEIPFGGKELDAWAAKVAEINGVDSDTGTAAVARVACSDILPKHDNLPDAELELARWRSVKAVDARDLMAIAIYGYCPEYKPLWEGDKKYREWEVKGVTPLTWH